LDVAVVGPLIGLEILAAKILIFSFAMTCLAIITPLQIGFHPRHGFLHLVLQVSDTLLGQWLGGII
jgi:hypothetical protein